MSLTEEQVERFCKDMREARREELNADRDELRISEFARDKTSLDVPNGEYAPGTPIEVNTLP